MTDHFSYYAKAYGGSLYAGLIYFMSVLAPQSHLSDITLLMWIGFAATVVGTWLGVAVITNGPKPGPAPLPTVAPLPAVAPLPVVDPLPPVPPVVP